MSLKERFKDAQLEIKDLRGRIDELRETAQKLEEENEKLAKKQKPNQNASTTSSKSDIDLDASTMAEEYEKYIRDMQERFKYQLINKSEAFLKQ